MDGGRGGVPTRMRALLDADPGGLKQSCAGGQRRFDPDRWDACRGSKSNQISSPPWPRVGSGVPLTHTE